MQNDPPAEQILKRVATGAIPVSAIRKMGPKGTLKAIRDFLGRPEVLLSLSKASTQAEFELALDTQTKALQRALSIGAHTGYWGTARKCLNIFLYECLLNHYLRRDYELDRMEEWLEVPLDSYVGEGIQRDASIVLPLWESVIGLTPANSRNYQSAAASIAEQKCICRVHLDLEYYGADRA